MKTVYYILLFSYFMSLSNLSFANESGGRMYKGSAIFYIKPKYIKLFKSEVERIIMPTRQEQDCISYEAFQVIDDNGKATGVFQFHELWKTKESMLIKHKENTKHMKDFFNKIKIGEKDSWVEKFEVSGSDVHILN